MSRFARRLLPGCPAIVALFGFVLAISTLVQAKTTFSAKIAQLWSNLAQSFSGALTRVMSEGFPFELIKSTLVAIVILAISSAWRSVPRSLDRYRARLFWGHDVAGGGIALCSGSLIDSRKSGPEASLSRYIKRYRDGREIGIYGPTDKVIGLCEVRAASHIINALSKYRTRPLPIEDDQSGLKVLRRSIICLGSAASNELTELVENDPRNRFLRIMQDNGSVSILCGLTGKNVSLPQSIVQRDFGIVLKIINSRFPGYFFFVCAGLGEWGTSGAAWYLANHWRELDELGDEFGCVVEVEIGVDQSAQIIYDTRAESHAKKSPMETEIWKRRSE